MSFIDVLQIVLIKHIHGSSEISSSTVDTTALSTRALSADAPEIATKPTRRLVAHGRYNATLRLRVPDATEQLANDAGVALFLMWVV
jgi:hypothetical protein